jgi:hypothetical protein
LLAVIPNSMLLLQWSKGVVTAMLLMSNMKKWLTNGGLRGKCTGR